MTTQNEIETTAETKAMGEWLLMPRLDGDFEVLALMSPDRDRDLDSYLVSHGYEIRRGNLHGLSVLEIPEEEAPRVVTIRPSEAKI